MMKIRKVLTILLTLTVLLSLVSCVNAASTGAGDGPNNIIVTYAVSEGYTLTIPSAVSLGELNQQVDVDPVHATNVVIPDDKYLQVSVKSQNGWKVVLTTGHVDNENEIITYKMIYTPIGGAPTEIETAAGVDEIILHHLSGSGPAEIPLSFIRTSAAHKAGTFEDMLTFTVSVVDA